MEELLPEIYKSNRNFQFSLFFFPPLLLYIVKFVFRGVVWKLAITKFGSFFIIKLVKLGF